MRRCTSVRLAGTTGAGWSRQATAYEGAATGSPIPVAASASRLSYVTKYSNSPAMVAAVARCNASSVHRVGVPMVAAFLTMSCASGAW